jgi:hypothetical protein
MKTPVVIRDAAMLDHDNHLLCEGIAELHLIEGFGDLVPSDVRCEMEDQVGELAARLRLSSGEILPVHNVSRCAISEPHYEFDLAAH